MKKKIIISSLISIILLIIGIFFINSSQKKISSYTSKGWYVVHAQGVTYPFEIALEKGRTYLDAIALLHPAQPVEHIYQKNSGKWEEVDKDEVIRQDAFLKID